MRYIRAGGLGILWVELGTESLNRMLREGLTGKPTTEQRPERARKQVMGYLEGNHPLQRDPQVQPFWKLLLWVGGGG